MKETLDAKNQYENTIYSTKNQYTDNQDVQEIITKHLDWLENHQTSSKEEYEEEMRKFVEEIVPFSQPPPPPEQQENNNDPNIEEVD